MPVSRMRMRPWLEQMIESRSVPGLQWVDKDKMMFSIPWKHAARHGWEMDKDASLFKMWAIHTGKYVEGQARDPKTWKANFRCAMNSLPDIEEVKDKSINKGHQAMRVFRMLPVTPKCRDKRTSKRRVPKVKHEEESSDAESAPSPTTSTTSSAQDSRVDSTVCPEPQESMYMRPDEVPEWSSLVEVGFSDMARRFEVSPIHNSCSPDDQEIIEICAQWERERFWGSNSLSSGEFLSNELQCTSPGSLYSESSSADELDEPAQYTNLASSFTTLDDNMLNFYPFPSLH